MKAKYATLDLRQTRLARKETQKVFWERFGCTQSAGSRYELGARMPESLRIVLTLYTSGAISDEQIEEASHRCQDPVP